MGLGRIIQTTLVSGEVAASFVFVAKEMFATNEMARVGSTFTLATNLGIVPLFGTDGGDSFAARALEMAVIAIGGAYRSPFPFVNGIKLDATEEEMKSAWASEILRTEAIIISKSPPLQIDFLSLVRGGTGASIGAFVGWNVGQATPPLLLVTVPAGMIICGAAMAVAQALEQGLQSKLVQLIQGQNSNKNSPSH